jgi:hypothetical protein
LKEGEMNIDFYVNYKVVTAFSRDVLIPEKFYRSAKELVMIIN